ncbi:MAG TPA: CaiB/BaiF CoA-transferase family protein [Pseudolabrys sp.]|nr:CaiB/BaiF CoA-transferase family protein [Pseudolabrys sp.]
MTENNHTTTHLPLRNVRVIDFSRLLPGPWCTQTLGDLGADVIKIEQPEIGDYSRFNPPVYRSVGVYFNSINRNKRSIALDLDKAEDRAVADDLTAGADVIVESFRPGVTKKLGIDYESVARRNPSVIYCSITGFGNSSALGRVPGHDLSIQGVAGILGKNLQPGQTPAMPPFQGGDFTAAAFATMGVLSAYIRRLTTGEGCYIEVPMYDSLISVSNVGLSGALSRLAGHPGKPEMEPWGRNPRYAIYPTRDGKHVTVCLLEYRAWKRFCDYIDRSDLAPDESWADRHTDHGEKSAIFRQVIGDFCLSRDRDALAAEMRDTEISICAIYTADEAVVSEHARERGIIDYTDHPVDGRIPHLVDPLAKAGLSDPRRRVSPGLGEHTQEIIQELRSDQQGRARQA